MDEAHLAHLRGLLQASLSAAVPLHIAELKRISWSEVERLARESAQIIAEKGDVIQFRSKKKGETAAAFNALARGLAAGAFVPGGIRFLDMHFEADHPDLVKARDEKTTQS